MPRLVFRVVTNDHLLPWLPCSTVRGERAFDVNFIVINDVINNHFGKLVIDVLCENINWCARRSLSQLVWKGFVLSAIFSLICFRVNNTLAAPIFLYLT